MKKFLVGVCAIALFMTTGCINEDECGNHSHHGHHGHHGHHDHASMNHSAFEGCGMESLE